MKLSFKNWYKFLRLIVDGKKLLLGLFFVIYILLYVNIYKYDIYDEENRERK